MKVSFIISLIIILLITIIYFLFLRKKKSIKTNIFVAIITCIIAISILIFPLLDYDNLYTRSFASFVYATKCIGMGQNLDILSRINLETTFGYLYFILINFLFLILPSLTVGFILSYLEKIIAYIKLKIFHNKKICIFSEINDKSLKIAKNLKNNCTIIFTGDFSKTDISVKSIILNKKITDIKINPKSNVNFYMISQNEEKNLNDTLELIAKYKKRDNTKIYVINKSKETPTILDSTDNGKIDVEIVNETERAIFNLLNNKPLFLNTVNNTISILIVGCGNIGTEFLKDSIWCGMLPNYKLEVLVVDKNADIIKDKLNVEMPELLSNYDITFVNGDIKSNKVMNIIKKRSNINYVLVSMETDDKNIDTAIMLRRLFIKEFDRNPVINLNIQNEYKQKQVLGLSNEKGQSYDLNAFGSLNDLYSHNNIIDSDLEKLAIQVHLSYDPEDKNLYRYNLREYNKRSSRACALHIKYKIYSVLGDKFTKDMKENQKLFKEIYSSEIEELLAKNEHNRWNAYMRSIGYVFVSTNDVAKYYKKTNHYIHYLAKMHPAITEYDKLDDISKELSNITSKKINLKDSDRCIVKSIYDKINL